MIFRDSSVGRKKRPILLLLCVWSIGLGGYGLSSNEAAAGAAPADAAELGSHSADAGFLPVYEVISLINQNGSSRARAISPSGRVAFEASPTFGRSSGYYYDGEEVINIGTFEGQFSRFTTPRAVNNTGRVVGGSMSSGVFQPFSWTAEEGMIRLSPHGGLGHDFANDVNNDGKVVGHTSDHNGRKRAFLWAPETRTMLFLGTLGGPESRANAINDLGQVVGESDVTSNPHRRAFLWTAEEGMINLGDLGGDTAATGINNAGQVVGRASMPSGALMPFFWSAETGMIAIGLLEGGYNFAFPAAINEAGQVVGTSSSPSGERRAFFWSEADGLMDLGTLGGAISDGHAINNRGQVVGGAFTDSGQIRAFIWTKGTGMVDLNTRISAAPADIVLHSAWAIADNGSILASSNKGMVLLKPGGRPCAAPPCQ